MALITTSPCNTFWLHFDALCCELGIQAWADSDMSFLWKKKVQSGNDLQGYLCPGQWSKVQTKVVTREQYGINLATMCQPESGLTHFSQTLNFLYVWGYFLAVHLKGKSSYCYGCFHLRRCVVLLNIIHAPSLDPETVGSLVVKPYHSIL